MEPICLLKGIMFIPFFFTISLSAQQTISFDLGTIRQKNHHYSGMNVSSFYHFNEKILGGVEVNRFFPVHRLISEEDVQLSGWDFEMNFHYLLSLRKDWKFYPVTGVSHTSEKELNSATRHNHYEHSWSVNTGAGMVFELGKWLPHIEYNFSWGRINQQFVLIGVGYEIEWGRHKEAHAGN